MKTGIEIKTGFFALAWFFNFCRPVIEINGQKNNRPWGSHYFETEPGEYKVKIYFPYLFMSQCGANMVDIKLEEGQVIHINYDMPPWVFAKGKIAMFYLKDK